MLDEPGARAQRPPAAPLSATFAASQSSVVARSASCSAKRVASAGSVSVTPQPPGDAEADAEEAHARPKLEDARRAAERGAEVGHDLGEQVPQQRQRAGPELQAAAVGDAPARALLRDRLLEEVLAQEHVVRARDVDALRRAAQQRFHLPKISSSIAHTIPKISSSIDTRVVAGLGQKVGAGGGARARAAT
ncbi:hypothetical protein SO694_00124032 [Aureococcus anophagefferens]|uniref:Uncharacterized protein n=1 Tax=Aureococcus anophagefferens TaxID=44056 RepID=A0ABR1G2X3_AURAN